MRTSLSMMLLAALTLIAVAACSSEPDGVVRPYPAQGNQYTLSELCQHLQNQGYDAKGTLDFTVTSGHLGPVLDPMPAAVKVVAQAFLSSGLPVQVEVQSLCASLAAPSGPDA